MSSARLRTARRPGTSGTSGRQAGLAATRRSRRGVDRSPTAARPRRPRPCGIPRGRSRPRRRRDGPRPGHGCRLPDADPTETFVPVGRGPPGRAVPARWNSAPSVPITKTSRRSGPHDTAVGFPTRSRRASRTRPATAPTTSRHSICGTAHRRCRPRRRRGDQVPTTPPPGSRRRCRRASRTRRSTVPTRFRRTTCDRAHRRCR